MHIDAAPAETQPLAGTASPQTQPVPPPPTQPLAGTAFPQTQPRQTQPLALQAPPQTQPLAGDASGDDSDDNDYEGLDSRAAVGEQSFEEETAQAERQHQGEDSEAEEFAFKLNVAAVVRVAAKANKGVQWLHIKGSAQPLAGVARQLSWTCKFTGMPVGMPKGLSSH